MSVKVGLSMTGIVGCTVIVTRDYTKGVALDCCVLESFKILRTGEYDRSTVYQWLSKNSKKVRLTLSGAL